MTSDLDLLRQFARENSQDAFGEIVRRHLDLVYSAALRQVCSPQLAEDVAQSVFADLARDAYKLKPDTVLTAWLYTVARRTAIDTVRKESRRQLREQIAREMTHMNATADDWGQIAPLLDEAMAALDETDRAAILLRYFENKSLREVGESLEISDDAAQKRVSRAVESLREFFSKQRFTIGASGLAILISANAVQAAPAGLAATISTAAAAIGAAIQTSTLATTAKTIAMTTLQKSIIVIALAAAAGTGIYAARENSQMQAKIQELSQQQAPLIAQLHAMQQDYAAATNELAALQAENPQSESDSNELELLRLRGQVTRLENQTQPAAANDNDPFVQSVMALAARAESLKGLLQQMPNKKIPELQLLNDNDWLTAAQSAQLDSDKGIRKAFQKLRSLAKDKLPIGSSLSSYASGNNGQLPNNLSELEPDIRSQLQSKFGVSLDDETVNSILDRYTLLHTGNASAFPPGAWFVVEKAPVDEEYDSREKFGLGTSANITTGIGESGDPDDSGY